MTSYYDIEYGFALLTTKNQHKKALCVPSIVAIQLLTKNLRASVEECEHRGCKGLHILIYFIL